MYFWTISSLIARWHFFVQLKNLISPLIVRWHFFVQLLIKFIFLILLTPLLNYISIIVVKYHIFLRWFFVKIGMCINGVFSPLSRLNSETEIQIQIFSELHRKRVHVRPFLSTYVIIKNHAYRGDQNLSFDTTVSFLSPLGGLY